jgi:NTE family protein
MLFRVIEIILYDKYPACRSHVAYEGFDEVKMKKCLAFVLGGGGSRGAMQVGALRALIEAGFKPDLLVGTSIGAVNAAGLALWGVDLAGVEALERAYQDVADAHLMDPRLARITLRALSGRPNHHASRRVEEYLISKGITADLRFDQVPHARLGLISSDLNTGQPVIYGQDTSQLVLEGIMASIAIPPWFAPLAKDGHFIMDGGALSNLPVEPAMTLGATEIIALDLTIPMECWELTIRQASNWRNSFFRSPGGKLRLKWRWLQPEVCLFNILC